jgi:hypothetical protein
VHFLVFLHPPTPILVPIVLKHKAGTRGVDAWLGMRMPYTALFHMEIKNCKYAGDNWMDQNTAGMQISLQLMT